MHYCQKGGGGRRISVPDNWLSRLYLTCRSRWEVFTIRRADGLALCDLSRGSDEFLEKC